MGMRQRMQRTFDVRRMVAPCSAVEGSAKIAMPMLHGDGATMGLLPDHDQRRRIIPDEVGDE
jgi:hypothetical protein